MTPIVKTVLALGALCLTVVFGTSFAHTTRTTRHFYRLLYAARNDMPEQVVAEYHHLPRNFRSRPFVQTSYETARKKVSDSVWFDFFPTTERGDVIAIGLFALGMIAFWIWVIPRPRKLNVQKTLSLPDSPTVAQMVFIRRINNGVIPVGLTKTAAATMIKNYLSKVSMVTRRQRIDISPVEFMSGSKSYREKMRLERERKRAQEKLARQWEQERRRNERESQREQKAAERLNDKRIAEEDRLIKAREEACKGIVHKTRSAKAQTIQEFQNFVNDILADKKIEPQEVRQLKAWLMANRQSPDDFSQMFKLIDESLVDGIIDADETQAIYEGIIDCLITLRERRMT